MTESVIGIDLGTTNSCIGVWLDNKVQIIANNQGSRTTPSTITFKDNDIIVGNKQLPNTIKSIKRFIGKSYDDKTVKKDSKIIDFNIEKGINNSILINGKTPTELSSIIINKMKEIADNYIGNNIHNAVITVPAYFNDSQRQETKKAGENAGLRILKIINEPTAAALAYGLNKKDDKTILVFDFGGGTFDVTLLKMHEDVFIVKATSGNSHLGGDDFDNKLIIYCLEQFCKKYSFINKLKLINNKKVLSKLKKSCEFAKKTLTQNYKANIYVESLYEGIDFNHEITRTKFEILCNDLFKKCLKPVDQVLQDSFINKNDVDEIILIGGSTRIPKIQQILSEYFNNKKLNKNIDPDEAVAYGATIQGAIITNKDKISDIVLADVNSLSLGIETGGGIMTNIINRNTRLPTSSIKEFSTFSDNQPSIIVKIYEGERSFVKNNHLLGVFTLSGLPMLSRGNPIIKIKFSLDINGILCVTASEESSNISKKLIINKSKNISDNVSKILENAEKWKENDEIMKNSAISLRKYTDYIYNFKKLINSPEFRDKLNKKNIIEFSKLANNEINWIENCNQTDDKEIEIKINNIENKICDYI